MALQTAFPKALTCQFNRYSSLSVYRWSSLGSASRHLCLRWQSLSPSLEELFAQLSCAFSELLLSLLLFETPQYSSHFVGVFHCSSKVFLSIYQGSRELLCFLDP